MDATARLFDRLRIAALAFPPCIAAAPPLGDNAEVLVGGRLLPLRIVVGRNTALGPCARLASLVLPAGFTPSGLPVALEFDAPAGADRRLLALGAALERVLPRLPEIGDVPRS
jgi:mandelamide amidase